jgi:hypothetical protein
MLLPLLLWTTNESRLRAQSSSSGNGSHDSMLQDVHRVSNSSLTLTPERLGTSLYPLEAALPDHIIHALPLCVDICHNLMQMRAW